MRLVPMRRGAHLPQDSSTVKPKSIGDVDHAGVLIHDDESARAHHGADGREGFVIHLGRQATPGCIRRRDRRLRRLEFFAVGRRRRYPR